MAETKGSMNGGAALVQTLIEHGIDTAFSVPGESYLPILQAIQSNANRIRLITPRHEQGVTFAAEAYGKLTGRPAAGFVSRGPGATNASIGIHTAAQELNPSRLVRWPRTDRNKGPRSLPGRELSPDVRRHGKGSA